MANGGGGGSAGGNQRHRPKAKPKAKAKAKTQPCDGRGRPSGGGGGGGGGAGGSQSAGNQPKTDAENEAAFAACQKVSSKLGCYIGLELTDSDGWTWADGTKPAWLNWRAGEPNNWGDTDEKAAIMNCCEEDASSTGTWYDAPGDWDLPRPLCMRDSFGCPSGWTERQGSCYKIEPTQRTRDECLAGALKRTLDFARRRLVNEVAERTLNELQTVHPAGLAE